MKTRNRIAILFCLAIAIPSAVAAQAAAQLPTSPVVIRVTDATGAVIPGAQIRLDPAPDPVPASMQTDQKGELSLELKPGNYAMEGNYRGFEKYRGQLGVPGYATEALAAASNKLITIVLHVPCTGGDGVTVPSAAGIVVEQDVRKPSNILRLSLAPYHDDLAISTCEFPAFHHITIRVHNAHTNSDEIYSGVALSDLLATYGVPLGKDLRGKALSLYVVAVGSDNYKAVLSLAEIDPEFHPGDVIVADEMGGKRLLDSGPFKLVVTEDKRPARSVHNLVSLELRSAD
jgi:hypothetical protein